MQKFFAEALGTFALVFAGTGAIIINDVSKGAVTHVGVALTFGLVILAMIYTFGDISGAHFNPAVTLGFWVAGKMTPELVLPYVISQLLGAICASSLLAIMFLTHPNLGATIPSGPGWQAFILELVVTFFLMLVILSVSTGAKIKGITAGIAVGSVIAFEALFAGPISGASMNPARSLAPALVTLQLKHLWIYLSAPIFGSFLSVLACRYVHSKDLSPEP
jgi:MIP family channel proteins